MSGFPDLTNPVASDLVNVGTQLNTNFDNIDAGFTGLSSATGITTPPVAGAQGAEWVNEDGLYKYQNGSGWQNPSEETWGSWTNLTFNAPYVGHTNAAAIRISSLKNVEMRGAVKYQTTTDPFPDAGYQLIHSGQFQNILPELTEVFPSSAQQVSTGYSWGYLYFTTIGSPLTLAIYAVQQGTRNASGTNNFLDFSNVRFKSA